MLGEVRRGLAELNKHWTGDRLGLAAVPIARKVRTMKNSSIELRKTLRSSSTLIALTLILGGTSAVTPVAYSMAHSDSHRYLASLQSLLWRTFNTPGSYEPSTLEVRPIARHKWAKNVFSQVPLRPSTIHHKSMRQRRRDDLGKLLAGVALAQAVTNHGSADAVPGR